MTIKPQILFSVFLMLLLSALLSIGSYAQTRQYSPQAAMAVETYAYLRGQSAALKEVAKQFPDLRNDVKTIEKKLKHSFDRAERNIELFLKDEMEESHFKLLRKQIDSLLQQQFKKPIEEEKYARDFLAKANERLYWISDSLLQKQITSFVYRDAPHEEIKDGYLIFFTTENHPKALQSDLKIPIPKSWLAEEAESPQTIQQFTSFNGTGLEKILITTYDLPNHMNNIFLSESTAGELLPPQSRLIRSEAVKIDGIPAIMIEAEEKFSSRTIPMKVRMLQFMFVQDKKLYCIQGSIGPVQENRNLDLHLKKYEPLFRWIAANTEIENQID